MVSRSWSGIFTAPSITTLHNIQDGKPAHHRRPVGDRSAAVMKPVLYPGQAYRCRNKRKAFLPAPDGQNAGCAQRIARLAFFRKTQAAKAPAASPRSAKGNRRLLLSPPQQARLRRKPRRSETRLPPLQRVPESREGEKHKRQSIRNTTRRLYRAGCSSWRHHRGDMDTLPDCYARGAAPSETMPTEEIL